MRSAAVTLNSTAQASATTHQYIEPYRPQDARHAKYATSNDTRRLGWVDLRDLAVKPEQWACDHQRGSRKRDPRSALFPLSLPGKSDQHGRGHGGRQNVPDDKRAVRIVNETVEDTGDENVTEISRRMRAMRCDVDAKDG